MLRATKGAACLALAATCLAAFPLVSYATTSGASAVVHASMQDLVAAADDRGLRIASVDEGGAASLSLSFSKVTVGDCSLATSNPKANGAGGGLTIVRGGIVEHVSSTNEGISARLIASAPPGCSGKLRAEISLTGATFVAEQGGRSAIVVMSDGRELRHEVSNVVDATGKNLSSSFQVAEGRAVLAVDAERATFPVEIHQNISDADWSAIARPDFNGRIKAVAQMGGSLFVGGSFTMASGGPANRLARWDGQAWRALGAGVDGDVNALAVDPWAQRLYVGGSFSTAGGVPARNLAVWNGTQFSALGDGTNGQVNALFWDDNRGRLIIGGAFTSAAGLSGPVTIWSSSGYRGIDSGLSGTVNSVTADGEGNVYAAGNFGLGTSLVMITGATWQRLGAFSCCVANSVVFDDRRQRLYVGGQFATVDGVTVNGLAQWDRTSWQPVGTGLGIGAIVSGLAVDRATGTVFIVGQFRSAGGANASNAAQWDGASLTPMSNGVLGSPNAVFWDQGNARVIVVGQFAGVAGGFANNIASFKDNIWTNLSGGTTGKINAVAVDAANGRVFVGGDFYTIGGVSAENVGQWNGNVWSPIGDGVSGQVFALAYDARRATLYVGGGFVRAGAASALMIAKWTGGNNWSDVGLGANHTVRSIAIDDANGDVYIGGEFTKVGAFNAGFVARWSGAWDVLGGGVRGAVRTLAFDQTAKRLYVGGPFNSPPGVQSQFIASYAGSMWESLGTGLSSSPLALAWDPATSRLYVGGGFTTAGSVQTRGLAVWQAGNWSALGAGTNGDVRAIAIDPASQDVYIGGDFTQVGGVSANRVAVVRAGASAPLGRGLNGPVSALAIDPAARLLYVGGDYTEAGDKIARFATLAITTSAPPAISGLPTSLSFEEGAQPLYIAPSAVVDDPDSTTLASAVIALGAGYQQSEDVLGFVGNDSVTGNIQATWDPSTATLRLMSSGATATIEQWQAALRTVFYRNPSKNPAVNNRVITVSISDGVRNSPSQSITVSVSRVNDEPAIAYPTYFNVIEATDSPITGVTLSDPDAGDAEVVFAVSVTTGALFALPGGGVNEFGSATDRIYAGSVSALNRFIASGSIRYRPPSGNAKEVPIYMSLNDKGNTGAGGAKSVLITSSVRIANRNDPPVFDGNPSISGSARVGAALMVVGASATDPDGDPLTYTYRWFRNGMVIVGATSQSYTLQSIDAGATINAEVSASDGLVTVAKTTAAVAVPSAPAVTVRDDRFTLMVGTGPMLLNVLANDVFRAADIATGSVIVVGAPTNGTATVDTAGTATPADDTIRYAPAASARGVDTLRYALCVTGGADCRHASVTVTFRPAMDLDFILRATSDRGYRDVQTTPRLSASGVRVSLSAFTDGVSFDHVLTPDQTPETPWDNNRIGTHLQVRRLPASAENAPSQVWTVVVDAEATNGADVDLYVGIDTNGDADADPSELSCVAAMSAVRERCEVSITQASGTAPVYWMLVHNRSVGQQPAKLLTYELLRGADGQVAITTPGMLTSDQAYQARVSWSLPALIDGQSAMALMNFEAAGGLSLGALPVRIDRAAGAVTPFALQNGRDLRVRVPVGGEHQGLFIDVPAGATSLTFRANATVGSYRLFAVRTVGPDQSSRIPRVGLSPPSTSAPAMSSTADLAQTIVVRNPQAGRWFVIPRNDGPSALDVTVRAEVEGRAPAVRAGGYFNPGRSGTGIFIYPAASEWAAILYTYLQDGTPTWYYLQGAQPQSNGIWRAPVYRSTWSGTTNALTVVGQATVTPVAANSFAFTYTIDGETGSEEYVDFGGGCPTLNSSSLNVSGHWFDPATAGSGYSIQMFPNYEFYAVFGYDGQGVARYLLAERTGFAGARNTMNLEQLNGTCLLCERTGNPVRRTIGTFTREFANGTLSRINLSGTYLSGVSGSWIANDRPVPLGGLQGCP